jgi:hypothetical protein
MELQPNPTQHPKMKWSGTDLGIVKNQDTRKKQEQMKDSLEGRSKNGSQQSGVVASASSRKVRQMLGSFVTAVRGTNTHQG